MKSDLRCARFLPPLDGVGLGAATIKSGWRLLRPTEFAIDEGIGVDDELSGACSEDELEKDRRRK